ncbi:MAG TPA: phosphoadenylyl-sulfate reductase [Stellaceae bacterium]|nr:phosphoadenylyl-sulfate reductase [Stellaceae bacterium]
MSGVVDSLETAKVLSERYGHLSGEALLSLMIETVFPGRIAMVSSFGAESAVLLHMIATIDPGVPVLFIDTGKLFGETLRYRDELTARLGLREVRTIRPTADRIAALDAAGALWQRNVDACCALRKTEPLAEALVEFDAWISGRKRYHGDLRSALPAIEVADGRIKINPLASWSRAELDVEFQARGLPRHPLEADGFLSIGCMPCTARVSPGATLRSGRWAGLTKTECGIHLALRRSVG